MKPLEQMLSPAVRTRKTSAMDANLQQNPAEILLIERIREQKKDVLNHRISQQEVDSVRPEIVDSWIRSYNNGLDLYQFPKATELSSAAFQELLEEKDLLLKVADTYICQLRDMLLDTLCVVYLFDEKGTVLLAALGKGDAVIDKYQSFPGVIWNEKTVGTTAHDMCAILGSPIQLCGPEHYHEAFSQVIASAAPIYDINHELTAVLSIGSISSCYQNPHTLGLVVSMAWAIQNDYKLTVNNKIFNTTLEASEEALITINKSGVITQANMAACRLFDFNERAMTGCKIEEVLGNQPILKELLKQGKPVLDTGLIIEKWNQKINLHSLQPVKDNHERVIGYVLSLNKANRIRKTMGSAKSKDTRFAFDQIIGNSPEMIQTVKMTRKFARLDANILLQGESGTGKEVYAQSIHNESRPNGPFMAVNCAAIPNNLMESELFGYEGGAFTGAERQGRLGKIELANGGTLFLDEIGDMPLELQPILLRALEEKKIMRIGGSRYISVDFNLVAATNKDLLELVEAGQFREDLYYRLAVFKTCIPPLRERGTDIIRLAKFFMAKVADRQEIKPPELSEEAVTMLIKYDWPGNVRQLENAIFYAVNMCEGVVVLPEHFPQDIRRMNSNQNKVVKQCAAIQNKTKTGPVGDNFSIKELEKIAITQAMMQTGNNIMETAKLLGFSKTTIYRKVKEYGIDG